MKQRFIRKNQNNRYIRPSVKRCSNTSAAVSVAPVDENNVTKEKDNMTKAEEVAAMVSDMEPAKKTSTKKATAKKADGLMEKIDVTLVTEDNKILLND